MTEAVIDDPRFSLKHYNTGSKRKRVHPLINCDALAHANSLASAARSK